MEKLIVPRFSPARWQAALTVSLLLCTHGLNPSAYAEQHGATTFDVPEAGTASGQGTFAVGINLLGAITGTTSMPRTSCTVSSVVLMVS